ncbi:hypothetical protein [Aquisalibacillus elongatus]|uniref:Uncharacterized protein n=1 Tax=Aquisalibacillus elongatus TaxID=485577 RepID=A0A3N5AZ75_9BACI|nr:hypothetical protein [Aquisalibacillus elongatus]RPF50576.1 hypothetical protein EDC24_2543 [Aquisalibacillus elongatus]
MRNKKLEVLFWSIAFPGFGQLLNHQLIKGITLIILEVVINVFSKFNMAIMYSFLGEIDKAIQVVDYQWLMFYPCIYFFGIWDAYKYAEGEEKPYEFLPFVFSAFFVTVGLMYSYRTEVLGFIIGPVWLPILFLIPGLAVGLFIRKLLIYYER